MSEFDQLKSDAEKEAQQHPQQVKEGEQDAEKEGKQVLDKDFGGQHDSGSGQQGQNQGGQGQ